MRKKQVLKKWKSQWQNKGKYRENNKKRNQRKDYDGKQSTRNGRHGKNQ